MKVRVIFHQGRYNKVLSCSSVEGESLLCQPHVSAFLHCKVGVYVIALSRIADFVRREVCADQVSVSLFTKVGRSFLLR